jgi:hypothetical protein
LPFGDFLGRQIVDGHHDVPDQFVRDDESLHRLLADQALERALHRRIARIERREGLRCLGRRHWILDGRFLWRCRFRRYGSDELGRHLMDRER